MSVYHLLNGTGGYDRVVRQRNSSYESEARLRGVLTDINETVLSKRILRVRSEDWERCQAKALAVLGVQ